MDEHHDYDGVSGTVSRAANEEQGSPQVPVVQVVDWQPPGVQRCIAASSRNFVGLMDDGCSVLKYPHTKTHNAMKALYEEAARYDHLGVHDNLVVFKGIHEHGLVFEYCEMGNLEHFIRNRPVLSHRDKCTIAEQITLGVDYLHKHNLTHCDISVSNVFITSAMIAKIGDMQGQLYGSDGSVGMHTMSQENAKSRHSLAGEDEFTTRTDNFALGTVFYHLWHGQPPFPDLDEYKDEDEVQAKYRRGEYPINGFEATDIDKVIHKCWMSTYLNTGEIVEDIAQFGEVRI